VYITQEVRYERRLRERTWLTTEKDERIRTGRDYISEAESIQKQALSSLEDRISRL
jgi:hypothetical protein